MYKKLCAAKSKNDPTCDNDKSFYGVSSFLKGAGSQSMLSAMTQD